MPHPVIKVWLSKKVIGAIFLRPKYTKNLMWIFSVCLQPNALPFKVYFIWSRAQTQVLDKCSVERFILVQCLLSRSYEHQKWPYSFKLESCASFNTLKRLSTRTSIDVASTLVNFCLFFFFGFETTAWAVWPLCEQTN